MIYTCYEMIRDCREGRPEGWRYLVAMYVPVIRKLLAHYGRDEPAGAAAVERVLVELHRPGGDLFRSQEPAPERYFVAHLRQKVLEFSANGEDGAIDLETVAAALEPLTLVEKQATWLETMLYSPAETGAFLRMAPATVEKIRNQAAELIRAKADSWSRTILAESGRALGRAAAGVGTAGCLPAKMFLDMLDGRTTWQDREEIARHATECWHCIDHFCRLVEVGELLRGNVPLSNGEAAGFWDLLGVTPPGGPAWKRWLTGKG